MVETKSAAKAAPVAAETAKPRAPRKAPNWKKDAEAKNDDAPLVIVQTQK
jgi:ribonuclease E